MKALIIIALLLSTAGMAYGAGFMVSATLEDGSTAVFIYDDAGAGDCLSVLYGVALRIFGRYARIAPGSCDALPFAPLPGRDTPPDLQTPFNAPTPEEKHHHGLQQSLRKFVELDARETEGRRNDGVGYDPKGPEAPYWPDGSSEHVRGPVPTRDVCRGELACIRTVPEVGLQACPILL